MRPSTVQTIQVEYATYGQCADRRLGSLAVWCRSGFDGGYGRCECRTIPKMCIENTLVWAYAMRRLHAATRNGKTEMIWGKVKKKPKERKKTVRLRADTTVDWMAELCVEGPRGSKSITRMVGTDYGLRAGNGYAGEWRWRGDGNAETGRQLQLTMATERARATAKH